jgi:hypothetical protein
MSMKKDKPNTIDTTTTGKGVKTVMVKITTLIPYPRNPRKNDAAVEERMIASIREFGFKIPILIRSDGAVIEGHLRDRLKEEPYNESC